MAMPVITLAPTPSGLPVTTNLDVERIRKDFPILAQTVHGRPLVYLDNAATSQKPDVVIDRLCKFCTEECSNVHRGVYQLSECASRAYEGARQVIQRFINAASSDEIVFVRGTTEAINLVAATFGPARVGSGDDIIVSHMEHHSNIVPWQMLAEHVGARLRVIPINDAGELLLDEYAKLLSPRTKLVAIVHVSNALGTINPVHQIVRMAHEHGVPVLVDGAQAAPHETIDVQAIDCDFYALSGHKVYGPTGIGVLYGKREHLAAMPPYHGGGDMIKSVTFEKTVYQDPPHKFEAGTPNISGALGLGEAIRYLTGIGLDRVRTHEQDLLAYATDRLAAVPSVRLIGTAQHKASVISFVMDSAHPHDIGTILDRQGIAIRTGHHCAQPLMERLGVPATARASLAIYNTRQDVDALVEGLHKVNEVFG